MMNNLDLTVLYLGCIVDYMCAAMDYYGLFVIICLILLNAMFASSRSLVFLFLQIRPHSCVPGGGLFPDFCTWVCHFGV